MELEQYIEDLRKKQISKPLFISPSNDEIKLDKY